MNSCPICGNIKPIIKLAPWGEHHVLFEQGDLRMKLLKIYPQQALSYQYHKKKVEVITLVEGFVEMLLDKNIQTMQQGALYVVPAGMTHRFSSPSGGTLLEMSCGDEDDICRLADIYGRAE